MNKNELKKYFNYLVKWVKSEVRKANANGVVVGLSGGIDSALVSLIAKKAFPKKIISIVMPIGDMGNDLVDTKNHAKQFSLNTKIINLTKTFETISKELRVKNKLAINNIKPRLRMTILYSIAQENNYLVLGTDNKAEWKLGYFTKHGDGGVDLLPIAQLLKFEVYEMARLLGVSKEILNKKPSAGLWKDQFDENELGVSYDEIDLYLLGNKISTKSRKIIDEQIRKTLHKRRSIPIPNKFVNNKI